MTANAKTVLGSNTSAVIVRSFYARVAALGFGLIGLTGIVGLVLALAGGDLAGNGVFGIVFAVVGLMVAGLVWRFGRWTLILSALLSLALLGLVLPFSLFNLAHPESAADFVPLVMMLAGALLGQVGSVVAIVQWLRRTARPSSTRVERLAVGGALGMTALAIVLSLALTLVSHSTVSAQVKVGATAVQIKNFSFTPNTLQVRAGDTVRLVVKNDDATLHTFTLPQAGVNVAVPPGSEKVIEFKAPAAGTYQWYCVPHSDANGATRTGMVGVIQVQ